MTVSDRYAHAAIRNHSAGSPPLIFLPDGSSAHLSVPSLAQFRLLSELRNTGNALEWC